MNEISFAIITEKLSKSFGKTQAVKNLNIEIPYGMTYGLLGPNGAGKTTTIRLLNAIIKPTSGNAVVAGYDIRSDKIQVKKNCGFLSETPGLYEKLTAKEFLEFVGSLYNIPEHILTLRVNELLNLFGLSTQEYELLENYSRGMKQKVSICAALIHNPKIIFLDEPTSNLDPATASMVKTLIKNLMNHAEKTFFISTHIINIAEELCDIIGIIDKGEMKIQGTPKEVIESVKADNLEDAYIRIMEIKNNKNFLDWGKKLSKLK